MADTAKSTSINEVIQRLPPELAPYYKELAAGAFGEAGRGYTTYGGQRIAEFTPNEIAAQQMMTQYGLNGDPNQSIDAYNLARQGGSGVLGLANQLGLDGRGAYADMMALNELQPTFRQQAMVGGENTMQAMQAIRDSMIGTGQSFADVAGRGYANADAAASNAVNIGNAYGDYASAAARAGQAGTGRATAISDMITGDLANQYNSVNDARGQQYMGVADAFATGPGSTYARGNEIGTGGFDRISNIGDRASQTGSYLDGSLSQYMDPYMDQVIRDRENSAMQRGRQMVSDLGSNAAMQGAFGGSRQGVLEANIASDTMRQMDQIRNEGLSTAYRDAQGMFEQDRGARQRGIDQSLGAQQAAEGSLQYGLNSQMGSLQGRLDALRAGSDQDQFTLGGVSSLLGTKLNAEQLAQQARQYGAEAYGQSLDRQLGAAGQADASRQYSTGLAGQMAGQNLGALQAAGGAEVQGYGALGQGQQLGLQSLQNQISSSGQANELLGQFRNQQLGALGQTQGLSNTLGNLGQAANQMQLGRIGALEGVGQQQRGMQQASMDMGYQDFQNQTGYNQQQLGFLSNILRGMPVQATQQTSTTQRNPGLMQSMFNTGVAGLGLYNAYQGG